MGKAWISLAVLTLALANARAELPPGSYNALRAKADEAVILGVDSVTTRVIGQGRRDVLVAARVLAVERSKSGLKPGQPIAIRYEFFDPAEPGPRPLKILKENEIYPAFLNAKAGAKEWEPAAFGESFTMTPEG